MVPVSNKPFLVFFWTKPALEDPLKKHGVPQQGIQVPSQQGCQGSHTAWAAFVPLLHHVPWQKDAHLTQAV